MAQGTLCNRKTIDTQEDLQTLLSDKGGKTYYEEMKQLDVDKVALRAILQKTFKSRLKTWLEICAHCGLCADSCFFYLANNKDPQQVPSYKIQSTLGEIVKRKGDVDNELMRLAMDTAWGKCTCCNRCGMYCPFGIDTGGYVQLFKGALFFPGFCSMGNEDRFRDAPDLQSSNGCYYRRLG